MLVWRACVQAKRRNSVIESGQSWEEGDSRVKISRTAVVVFTAGAVISSCGPGTVSSSAVAKQLARKIILAPPGYYVDTTPGSFGQISPTLFQHYGGGGARAKSTFVAGYKGNYVNSSTGEGISITLLEFRSVADATAYLGDTATQTLSFAAATYSPYPAVPGATEVDGTKPYNGDYDHGIVMSRGKYYAQLVYVINQPASAPSELKLWAEAQYAKLT